MSTALVLAGTKKGLFLIRSTDGWATWSVSDQLLGMQSVYGVAVDARGERPRLFASTHSEHWGPAVAWSDDLGETWSEVREAPVAFPSDVGASVERVWQIQPGPANQPGVVWAGTEPAALFRSADGGESFTLVRSLWDHPHRPQWMPGFGGQALHTVIPHPHNPQRLLIAISAGGAYATDDGGETWSASNSGVEAEFMPPGQRYPEFGQCVHKIDRSPLDPEQLFMQNHGGVYRSDDGGRSWSPIDDGLPASFGFGIVAHPARPGTAYVIPLDSSGHRNTPNAECAVYRTTDSGESWQSVSKGLPDGFWSIVLRDAFTCDAGDPLGLFLGTRSGEVYGSADEGESWQQLAAHLPDVLSVRAAVLE